MLAPRSADLAPGLAFGGYVVRELIGRGAMASVYRAEHVMLHKPVALKLMDRSLLVSPGAGQRFLREGRAVAAIKHPNVVNITDVGVHDGVPFLVMELLRGEDLEHYLQKHAPLDDLTATRLALPLVAALDAAHASGVVHRDVKPSNIFLSRGPNDEVIPKVLDFGISKLSFGGTEADLMTTPQSQIMGTPLYLPPEALCGAEELGPAADQYSLGVVLYQCVTGRTPFAGDNLLSLLSALTRGSFDAPRALRPDLSPALERVILKAMSADPGDRYPSLREMGRELLHLAAARTQLVWENSFKTLTVAEVAPTSAPRESQHATVPLVREAAPAHRARTRVIIAAAALLAALGVAAVGLSQLDPDGPPRAEPVAIEAFEPATAVTHSLAPATSAAPTVAPPTVRLVPSVEPEAAPARSARAKPTPVRRPRPPPALEEPVVVREPPSEERVVSEPPSEERRHGANASPLLD